MFLLFKLDLCFKVLVEHDAAIENLINNCNPAWLIAFRSLQNILQVVVETESQKNTLGIEKGCQKCFSNILHNILHVWWKLKVKKRLWDWEGLPKMFFKYFAKYFASLVETESQKKTLGLRRVAALMLPATHKLPTWEPGRGIISFFSGNFLFSKLLFASSIEGPALSVFCFLAARVFSI